MTERRKSAHYGEGITVAQTEVGKSYYVINGSWRFKVMRKDNTHTYIQAAGHGEFALPNDSTVDDYTLEEYEA